MGSIFLWFVLAWYDKQNDGEKSKHFLPDSSRLGEFVGFLSLGFDQTD